MEISPVFLYLMAPVAVFLPHSSSLIYLIPVYLLGVVCTWRNPGVKSGDALMLVFYCWTTVNNPVTGFQALLLISGLYILVLQKLGYESVPFAPVFTASFLLTQLHWLLWV